MLQQTKGAVLIAGILLLLQPPLRSVGDAAAGMAPNNGVVPNTVLCSQAAAQLPSIDWSQVRDTRLLGAAAREYVAAKASADGRFRAARERARRSAAARGWQPTDVTVVIVLEGLRLETPARPAAQPSFARFVKEFFLPTLQAQTYYEDGVETIYESWDDFDNDTWEGNVFARKLSTDEWISVNDQKYIASDQEVPIIWAENIDRNLQIPPFDCRRTGSQCGYCADAGSAECNLRAAMTSWWFTCSGSALSCLVPTRGPGWVWCIGTRCGGVLGLGFLYQTKEHMRTCWLDEVHQRECGG
jgi:hypothetical protein